MKILKGAEEKNAMSFLENAVEVALNSNCLRSRCGSVIVKENEVIGIGFNSPPNNKKLEQTLDLRRIAFQMQKGKRK